MTISEAVKSRKKFRRAGSTNWYWGPPEFGVHWPMSLTYADLSAEDWEIEEQKVEITEQQALNAYTIVKRYFDCRNSNPAIDESCWSSFKRALRLK